MPGFAVFFQAHLFGLAVRVEAEHGLGSADFDGDDVPDVERDDVGGDEMPSNVWIMPMREPCLSRKGIVQLWTWVRCPDLW